MKIKRGPNIKNLNNFFYFLTIASISMPPLPSASANFYKLASSSSKFSVSSTSYALDRRAIFMQKKVIGYVKINPVSQPFSQLAESSGAPTPIYSF